MKHTFLDLYREGHSPVHRLEPRSKFLATLAFILAASLMPAGYWPGFAALALVILGATLVAGVPLRVALGRSLVVLPSPRCPSHIRGRLSGREPLGTGASR